MRHFKFVLGILLAFGSTTWGCDTLPPPPGVAQCSASQAVRTCAATETRAGTQCAICDDANLTLTCAFHDKLATCVSDCTTCDGPESTPVTAPFTDPGQLVAYGVHVCWPARYRESSWCARCPNTLNVSLATELCDKDGFCNPVVCVASCDACELAP